MIDAKLLKDNTIELIMSFSYISVKDKLKLIAIVNDIIDNYDKECKEIKDSSLALLKANANEHWDFNIK